MYDSPEAKAEHALNRTVQFLDVLTQSIQLSVEITTLTEVIESLCIDRQYEAARIALRRLRAARDAERALLEQLVELASDAREKQAAEDLATNHDRLVRLIPVIENILDILARAGAA